MSALSLGSMTVGAGRGVLQVHVVQSKQLRRSVPLPPATVAQQGFSVALHVGLFQSAAAAAFTPSVAAADAVQQSNQARPHQLSLLAGADGTAVWNQEVEFEFRNADAWLFVHAQAVPLDEQQQADCNGKQSATARRRSSKQHQIAAHTLPGEARIPIKEYASRVFHDLWLPLGPPVSASSAAAGGASATPYVAGLVHVRLLWLLEDSPRQLAALARVPAPLSPLLGTLLHRDAHWVQVLLLHADRHGQDAPPAAQAALVQSTLAVLAHARFDLLLHVLERLVAREVDELGKQFCALSPTSSNNDGNNNNESSSATGMLLTSAWASNLFRRNSLTPKLLSAFCLQQQQQQSVANGAPSTGLLLAHEGVGKPYVLALLAPFIQRVIDVVANAPTGAAAGSLSAAGGNGIGNSSHSTNGAGAGAAAADEVSSNPFETDPSRVGHDRALLARNQANLLRACQALLDLVLSSLPHAEVAAQDGSVAFGGGSAAPARSGDASSFWSGGAPPSGVPAVPVAIRVLARSIRRAVEDYASKAPSMSPASGGATTAAAGAVPIPRSGKLARGLSEPSSDAPGAQVAVAQEAVANSLASFFFLRFLCPALVAPAHYGLLARPPPPAASRALILIAKLVQSLVNAAGSAAAANSAAVNATANEQHARGPVVEPRSVSPSTTPMSSLPRSSELTFTTPAAANDEDASSTNSSRSGSFSSTAAAAAAAAASPLSSTSTSAATAASARLFKESWFEFAYPFINANLSRVSRFLTALGDDSSGGATAAAEGAVSGNTAELLPGAEENPLEDPPALDIIGGVEASPVRDLERALWTLVPFLQAQMAGLEETAVRLHCEGVLRIPAADPALLLSPSLSPASSSPLAPSGESGLSALRELTRPRHYAKPASARRSFTPAGVTPSAHACQAQVMSRFRNTVLNVSVPAAVESAYQSSMNRRASTATASSPAADSGEAALSALGVASLAHAPAAVGERLAQVAGSAARNSMKFLSRFLPGSAEKEGTGTLTRNASTSLSASGGVGGSDGHSPLPSQPLQRKSSRLAPLHVLSPQSGGAGGGVFSDSSSSSGSCGGASAEDFTLFKQTSIEIQLRLTAALEDADKRAHSLLVSYQHEEEKTRSQAEQMQRMQAQIEELQRQNQELQAATAAVSAASSASGTAPASAASSVAPAAPTAVPDDSFSTSPCIQVTPRARVRRARAEDVVHMDAMIRELALYERAPEAVVGTADMLAECLFGPNPRLHAHVLEVLDDDGDDGAQDASAAAADGSANGSDDAATSNTRTGEWRVQGMAIWFLTYSTWLARHGIWLEDLYVRPAYRGGGMGRALLRALASECVTRGYQRLDWYVLDWNEPAHKAYRAIGAAPLDEWSLWRLEGDKLDKFGTEATTKSASPPTSEVEAAASKGPEANGEPLAAEALSLPDE